MARKPSVLIVDDRPDNEARTYERKLKERNLDAFAYFPADVDEGDLSVADLILVDFDLEEWVDSDDRALELARRPKDGVALAAVLRRCVHDIDTRKSPTAVALITQKIASAMRPLPPTNRAHIAASLNGLEWIFDKNDKKLLQKIEALASATLTLPKSWGDSDLPKLSKLLGISDSNKKLAADMLEDALRCVPPIHEIRDWEQGIAIIRWLLHRVLPYPCFLIDVNHLAARLSVDPRDLREALEIKGGLRRALEPYSYRGILSEFSEERWWRVGVEAFLWEKTAQRSFESAETLKALNKFFRKKKLVGHESGRVAVVDENFEYGDVLFAKSDSVRIWPDDWPSFALQPWTSLALAKKSAPLSALVIESDRHRL